jgi:hypothetical protein
MSLNAQPTGRRILHLVNYDEANPVRNIEVTLQLPAEFFNIFNRANFLDPGTTVSAAGFGSIKSANDPRIGQLALKLNF